MKTTILIVLAILASINLVVAQEAPASSVVQGKVVALNQKYPVLFDAESDGKEATCEAAIAQLKDDAELAQLKAQLQTVISDQSGASNQTNRAARISQLSQALQSKQFEKIAALRPEVRAYLEAKANHQRERAALLREYANDASALQTITEGTKRRR